MKIDDTNVSADSTSRAAQQESVPASTRMPTQKPLPKIMPKAATKRLNLPPLPPKPTVAPSG